MSSGMSRREVLGLALASPLVAAASSLTTFRTDRFFTSRIEDSPSRVVALEPAASVDNLQLRRVWRGSLCSSQLINHGPSPVAVKEIVLFEMRHTFPSDTHLYGEGFQMLTQTGGTVGEPVSFSQYTDAQHYKLPAPIDAVFAGLPGLGISPNARSVMMRARWRAA